MCDAASSHFLGAQLLPSGYLAVDLFFMLSGFVFLNGFSLIALLVTSAVAFILVGIHYGTVDIGMRDGEALAVLPRVIFSFFAGLALRRSCAAYRATPLIPTSRVATGRPRSASSK